MSFSPQGLTPGSLYSTAMPSTDLESSQYIYVRDYQNNVSNLENENFTLKMLLSNLQSDFRKYLKSKQVNEDIVNSVVEKERAIARLTAEIGRSTDFSNNSPTEKTVPQSPSLKQQLKITIDENLRLMDELKSRTQQQYEDAVEVSEIVDDGAQVSIDNLELKNKISELISKNNDLNQDLINQENELEDCKAKISQLTNKITQKEDLLASANKKNRDMQLKISQLEKQLASEKSKATLNDVQNAVSQIESINKQNSQLLQENTSLKHANQLLNQEREQNAKLAEQLESANSVINNFKNTVARLEYGNSELMNVLNVLEFEEIGPKFDQTQKENSALKTQFNLLQKETTSLKDQVFQLRTENQKLQNINQSLNSQLKQKNENKAKKNNKLHLRNLELKRKKANLLASIERIESGNSNISLSSSFTPVQSPYPSFIKEKYIKIKKENEELTKDVEELNSDLIKRLYSKITQLSTDLLKNRRNKSNFSEIESSKENMLLINVDQLQNENFALTQQIEIIKGENEDLIKEIDNLRVLQRNATIQNKTNYNDSVVEDLKRQISYLQIQNNELRSGKSAEVAALKNENQKLLEDSIKTTPVKRENGRLKIESDDLRNSLEKERNTKLSLANNIKEISKFVEDKIQYLLDNYNDRVIVLFSNMMRIINKVLIVSKNQNNDLKSDINLIYKTVLTFIEDMKNGVSICIRGCDEKIKSNSPFSRDDRRKVTNLQNKWRTKIEGNLEQIINNENEKSILNLSNSSSFITNPKKKQQNLQSNKLNIIKDSSKNEEFDIILEHCNLLIHTIWVEFGTGTDEPFISSFHIWSSKGQAIVQNIIKLFRTKVDMMKQQIKAIGTQPQQISIVPSKELSPKIVNILTKVRKDIQSMSKQMHDDHADLLTTHY